MVMSDPFALGRLSKRLLSAQAYGLSPAGGTAVPQVLSRVEERSRLRRAAMPVKLTRKTLVMQTTAVASSQRELTEAPTRGLTPEQARQGQRQRELRVPMIGHELERGRLPKRLEFCTRKSLRPVTTTLGVWAKHLKAKRAKAQSRQLKHTMRLRASLGERGILETRAMGNAEPDYQRRVGMLWDFMGYSGLEEKPTSSLDAALSEYSDWAYLLGESCEHGDKLKASLAALYPNLVAAGVTQLP